jgi:hypothetical protein
MENTPHGCPWLKTRRQGCQSHDAGVPVVTETCRQDRTGQDRTGQDRTGQDRTGQDRTGQDRTGQDSNDVMYERKRRPGCSIFNKINKNV